MGSVLVNRLVVAIVTFALLATAATTPDPPYPVTAAAELVDTSFATSNPIRTVVTVNSNRVDVLAADEKDVPKVLEKLRELCAGPFASLYPEICEHLGEAGEDLDLGGLDDIIWGPSKNPKPQIATSTSKAVGVPWSDPPSTRPLSTSLAEETGSTWTQASQSSSSVVSESAPAATSTSFPVTLTVPVEIKTTKSYEVVVHEVPETASGLSATATVVNEETSTAAKSQVPTTLETKIKSSSTETGPSDAESDVQKGTTEKTIVIPNSKPNDEAGKPISTTSTLGKSEEDNKHVSTTGRRKKDDSEAATTATTNINSKYEQPTTASVTIPTKAKSETDKTISTTTTIASTSSEAAKVTPTAVYTTRPSQTEQPLEPTTQSEKATFTTSSSAHENESKKTAPSTNAYGESEKAVSSTSVYDELEPETQVECPWKTGDEGDDDRPGPCTVITIWHYGTLTFPHRPTLPISTLGPPNSEFRPVFTPTASPRPSRTRTSFDITLPTPPSTDLPPLWFATTGVGCTQTVSLVLRINDPFTSTIYPATVTSTALISCSCQNLATEYIVRHGIVIIPRTTVSALDPTTIKAVGCSDSQATSATWA